MTDRYDEEVARLTLLAKENPDDEILYNAWNTGHISAPCSILFNMLGSPAKTGCLTQIAHQGYTTGDPHLDQLIRADTRIPQNGEHITPDNLPVFAEWQRRIDQEFPHVRPVTASV